VRPRRCLSLPDADADTDGHQHGSYSHADGYTDDGAADDPADHATYSAAADDSTNAATDDSANHPPDIRPVNDADHYADAYREPHVNRGWPRRWWWRMRLCDSANPGSWMDAYPDAAAHSCGNVVGTASPLLVTYLMS
jgi:hypothetical protein